jgi:FkbM family methyltransferase
MKQRLLFIAPHLSTGGMPQYLYKQITALLEDFDVYCIEWDNVTGGVLVVQRNRILEALGDRLITLGEDKTELLKYVNYKIKPDIVHLQEIPEMFMGYGIAEKLYATDRKFRIVETSHDSSYDVTKKQHFPDKFMMVSRYQVEQYKSLNIPCELVEYPIEDKIRTKTREELMSELGIDPNKKHVITVGLFTPRKNQAEVIEYAKMLQDQPIQFHFIGNQADNFKHYWEPIMKDFPSNCKWWGERSDVDTFYQIADLFLFTSRGFATDKETMPLVIREAISWKVPSLIYNLDVYLHYFNKYGNVGYLNTSDKIVNILKIIDKLELNMDTVQPSYNFWSKWDKDQQQMYFGCYEDINEPLIVSLREYMSDGVFWSSDYTSMPKDVAFWMIPVDKGLFDYEKDPNYTGIKICIYKKKDGKKVYEQPYFSKFVDVPRVSLSNSIPYHLNYTEFFIHDKYAKYFRKKYHNVVDVGANVGVFTEYLIQNEHTEKVIAVECDPKALYDLTRNFKREYKVEIIPKALYHENTKIIFYHSEENPVISSTIAPDKLVNHMAGVKGNDVTEVETITIKDLVDKLGIIDLLKIDIEGGEYGVIENLDPSLFAHINNFLIECHFFEADYKVKYNMLLNKLRDGGYMVEEFVENQSDNSGTSEVIFASKI